MGEPQSKWSNVDDTLKRCLPMSDSEPSDDFTSYIEAAAAGDQAARDRLIELTNDRLRTIARSMMKQFPNVKRWEETDDVWQSASLRLWRSLEKCELENARHFFNLAALQIRRELIELARHYTGPHGLGRNYATPSPHRSEEDDTGDPASSDTFEASRLAAWTEIHEQVETLPDDEREVFALVWYQGLSQQQIASLLDVSVRTVKRRWQAARLQLHDKLEEIARM